MPNQPCWLSEVAIGWEVFEPQVIIQSVNRTTWLRASCAAAVAPISSAAPEKRARAQMYWVSMNTPMLPLAPWRGPWMKDCFSGARAVMIATTRSA